MYLQEIFIVRIIIGLCTYKKLNWKDNNTFNYLIWIDKYI